MSSIRGGTTTGLDNTTMRASAVAILTFLVLAGSASAHPALYHYLEINLLEPGAVSVYVTFHAPELSEEVAPLEEDVFGREWLATRDDETLAVLVDNAGEFASAVFSFQLGDHAIEPTFVFPDFETIRRPPPGSVVPDGCFSGEGALSYGSRETELRIDFSSAAEKRLMLIINRPAAFPEVIDLEPGGRYILALPEAPIELGGMRGFAPVLVAGLLLILVIALMRRRRACF